MTGRTPDLFEPLLVFRHISIRPRGTLSSLAYTHVWKPGWNMATCGHGFPPDQVLNLPISEPLTVDSVELNIHGPAPAVSCTCGFYAFYFPGQFYLGDGMSSYLQDRTEWPAHLWRNQALAACHVKGRTQLYDKGLRVQYMKILALSSFCPEYLPGVAERYPDIRVPPSPVELLEEYPPQDHSALVGSDVTPWAFGPPRSPKEQEQARERVVPVPLNPFRSVPHTAPSWLYRSTGGSYRSGMCS